MPALVVDGVGTTHNIMSRDDLLKCIRGVDALTGMRSSIVTIPLSIEPIVAARTAGC